MNNFQRLEEEEIDRLPDLPLGIAQNVNDTLGGMRTFGSIVELYLAKIFDVVTMMAGGEVKRPQNKNTFTHTGGHGSPTEPNGDTPRGPKN